VRRDWDAIVVGASFGGLGVATELAGAGRVLLVDRQAVGDGETSACGTLLRVLERLDALDALDQVHEEIVLHLARSRTYRFRPAYPFATFDYRRLCEILRGRTDAEFLRASVTGVSDGSVVTSAGSFRAPIVIDASGWRAALGPAPEPSEAPMRSLGIELRKPVRDEGLHFWIRPDQIDCGVTWVFPAGDESHVGIACYRGRGGLKPRLEKFLDEPVTGAELHGGFFPSKLRDPVSGEVFLVGDSGGQCLPLTGEGIRPALVFGQVAGRLARQVLEGTLDLAAALACYRRLVLARRPNYTLLRGLQRGLLHAPSRAIPVFAKLFGDGALSGPAHRAYWWIADPDSLRPGPADAVERPSAECPEPSSTLPASA